MVTTANTTTTGRTRWQLPLTVGSAMALAVGAIWRTLVENEVTVSPSPPVSDGLVASEWEAWYAWWATTLPQSRVALAVLLLGLVGVALTALRTAGPSWASRGGAVAMAGAVALWSAADVAQAGAMRAIELMAVHDNPIDAVGSIAFTVDVATSWVEAGAAITLGAGATAMAVGLAHEDRRRQAILTGLVAAAAVGFGTTILVPDLDTTVSGLALGVVLLPIWVITMSAAGTASTVDQSQAVPALSPVLSDEVAR